MSSYDKGFETRKFIKSLNSGVLSTISVELEGYPFGSVVPFCLSENLEPIILISNIAQHTKNINQNSKVSLTIFDNSKSGDIQANARVTYIGNAISDNSESLKNKYEKFFPQSKKYFEFHDFSIYKIILKKIRFIDGFGKIFWLTPEEFIIENPLKKVEDRIISHMNKDHNDSIIKYCKFYKNVDVTNAEIIGIDSEGFDVIYDNSNLLRFTFDENISNLEQAREILVKMAKESN